MGQGRKQLSLYVEGNQFERIEDLIPAMKNDPTLSAFGQVTRSVVLRLALSHGIAELERLYPPPAVENPRKNDADESLQPSTKSLRVKHPKRKPKD